MHYCFNFVQSVLLCLLKLNQILNYFKTSYARLFISLLNLKAPIVVPCYPGNPLTPPPPNNHAQHNSLLKSWSMMFYSGMYLRPIITTDMFLEVLNERNTILTAIFMPHEPRPYMSINHPETNPFMLSKSNLQKGHIVLRGFKRGTCHLLQLCPVVLGKSSEIMKLHDKVIFNSHQV